MKSEFESRALNALVGGKITGVVETPDNEDHFYGLEIKIGAGKTVTAWIQCDPEGNGPGFLSVQEDEK